MLAENGFQLTLTGNAADWISEKGFDPQYGARPVKRIIQKYVLNELSKQFLAGMVEKSQIIEIDTEDGKLVFRGK